MKRRNIYLTLSRSVCFFLLGCFALVVIMICSKSFADTPRTAVTVPSSASNIDKVKFNDPVEAEKLYLAMEATGYDFPVGSATNPMGSLNKLLEDTAIYSMYKSRYGLTYSGKLELLAKATTSYRNTNYSQLSEENQAAICQLNRMVIQETFPASDQKVLMDMFAGASRKVSDIIRRHLFVYLVFSYFFGKGLEFTSNKYFSWGWKVIKFKTELFNFVRFVHVAVIYGGNLDIFVKNKNWRRFHNALEKRKALENKRKLKIYYIHSDDVIANLGALRKYLVDNEHDNLVELVQFKKDFPDLAFFGERTQPSDISFLKALLPRYHRYKNKRYFSGISTDIPFITNTDRDNYRMLAEYTQAVI